MMRSFIIIFLFFIVNVVNGVENNVKITCLDHNNKEIDWSITYKLPKVKTSTNPFFRRGSGYTFLTPGSTQWTDSENEINNPESLIGKTLESLYKKGNESIHILYNDQPPGAPTIDNNGHTKGVILANSKGGIWLIHSVPHFPSLTTSAYNYPPTGYRNGQIFLCLTLNATQIDGIAEVFTFTRPNIFNYSFPSSFSGIFPNLSKIVHKSRIDVQSPPWYKMLQLHAGDLDFYIFAKGPKFRKEIYADWIAPKLQTPLNVQSWQNGPNPYASNCSSQFPVHNILLKDIEDQNFSSHSDHSKWAVGTDAKHPWVCIGDLNRMEHQTVRGGGVLCTLNRTIWNVLSSAVTEIQPCPRKRRIGTWNTLFYRYFHQ